MTDENMLIEQLHNALADHIVESAVAKDDMVTIEVKPAHLLAACHTLHDHQALAFDLLLDICGVDYLDYGISEWRTHETTTSGYSRAVESPYDEKLITWDKPRFAVVYHLLSIKHNHRLRLCTYVDGNPPQVPSVINIWSAANWFEREVFDLFGILFEGHPDLRRLLTDYGFVGHPFRKDFPLIGEVELRYDAKRKCCVYEPVSIQPRVLVPKVIRDDNRYLTVEDEKDKH